MATQKPFPHLRREASDTSTLNWGRALPSVVRLLADRRADVPLPACPIRRSGDNWERSFAGAVAYWTALDHILRFHLGWTLPAQGLARWIDEGAPDEAGPLALVRHVWLGDGHLARYVAWRVEKNGDHLPSVWMARVGQIPHEHAAEGEPIGPWQLHLEEPGGHSLAPETDTPPKLTWLAPHHPGPLGNASPALLGRHEPVMLFSGSLETGWYGALHGSPTGAARVISERYGLVGRFIRSPHSGRWHTTTEEFHSWGTR